MNSRTTETLIELYEDFNARRIEAVLGRLDADVLWPDMINRQVVRGHDAVRSYWTSQWAMIDPTVSPISFDEVAADEVHVRVAQTIRTLDGEILDSSEVVHQYWLRDGLVTEMTVRGEILGLEPAR